MADGRPNTQGWAGVPTCGAVPAEVFISLFGGLQQLQLER